MKFKFERWNDVRYARGADAAQVLVTDNDGDTRLLWMSQDDVANNVKSSGPHFALIQAAGKYGIRIAPMVEQWRAGGKGKDFLAAQDLIRDRDGTGCHQHWPDDTEDYSIVERWIELIGFEINAAWMTSDPAAREVWERYNESDPDFLAWEPGPPAEAEGWFIASIHDHEDGPVCIWLRDKVSHAEAN